MTAIFTPTYLKDLAEKKENLSWVLEQKGSQVLKELHLFKGTEDDSSVPD